MSCQAHCLDIDGFTCLANIVTGPAWLGVGMTNPAGVSTYMSPNYVNNYQNTHPAFIMNMWNGWNGAQIGSSNNTAKCEFWMNKITHWTNQINNNTYSPYMLGRKKAKIVFAQKMWVVCKCSGPPPHAMVGSENGNNNYALEDSKYYNREGERGMAPEGFHYMPDGSLMSDAEHEKLYKKVITELRIDFVDIPTAGETKEFSIIGDSGAEFYLEIKNEDSKYYNFVSKTFQTKYTKLDKEISSSGAYTDYIVFPAVTDNDQYDIYLYTKPGTKHAEYDGVNFGDGSKDLNSSTGSTSILMQKVIYQVLDISLAVTVSNLSATYDGITGVTLNAISAFSKHGIPRLKPAGYYSFEFSGTVTSNAITLDQQPTIEDLFTLYQPVIGAAPIYIEGENIYPTATPAFTGDDVNGAVTSGSVVRLDNSDLSAVIKVGDKITTTVMTDTVNGARDTSAVAVTMDSAVATKMAVGDKVTGNAALDAGIFTVASLDSTNVFSISAAVAIADGVTLSFSSKINRSTTTVTVVETDAAATDFTMSQAIQFRDNAPLTFFNRMNYRWPVTAAGAGVVGLTEDMKIFTSTGVTGSYLYKYEDKITIDENTEQEREIIHKTIPAVDTRHTLPTIVNGRVSTQAGNIVFNAQQPFATAGDELNVVAYDLVQIKELTGWDVSVSNIKASLNTITTTTTAAVSASTTIPVASVLGIADETTQTVNGTNLNSDRTTITFDSVDGLKPGQTIRVISSGTLVGNPKIVSVNKLNKKIIISTEQYVADGITVTFSNSTISGPGIAVGVIDPYITNISGSNLTVSAAQTLEDGQTFTFPGAGNVVTITGDVVVNKAGSKSLDLIFDVNRFLTYHS